MKVPYENFDWVDFLIQWFVVLGFVSVTAWVVLGIIYLFKVVL